jgi:hypothetical protein
LRTRGRGGKREKTSDILSESCSSHIPLRIAPTNNLVIGPVVACALHLSRQTIELRGSAAPRNGASCVLQFASLAAVLPSLPPPGGRSILLPFPKPISFSTIGTVSVYSVDLDCGFCFNASTKGWLVALAGRVDGDQAERGVPGAGEV